MQCNLKKLSLNLSLRQQGQALIFIVIILGLAATAYTIRVFNTHALQLQQDSSSSISLADAKAALIGYTLSRVGSGERPGDMPRPDHFATSEAPSNYDGNSDGGCLDFTKANGLPLISSGTNMRCLGRLPWRTLGMSIPSPSQNDSLGYMPWYAVSANLVDPSCFADTDTTSGLNPGILNMTYTSYVCDSATFLPHPWLTVRDAKGNILSSRVAAILILPRAALSGQSRPSATLGDATNYLDTVTVPSGCAPPCVPGTYGNSDYDNSFIMASGPPGANADANDRVLYITIDELMEVLVKRAAGEVRTDLNTYRTANGRFPFASPLAAPLGANNYVAAASESGTIPADVTDTITCNFVGIEQASCSVAFSLVGSVSLQRTVGYQPWDPPTGACSRVTIANTNDACRCTGAGSCTTAFSNFTCNAAGVCNMSLYAGTTGKFIYTPSAYGSIPPAAMTSNCSISGTNNVECDGDGTFGIRGILSTPDWFRDNNWQDYFYYYSRTAADLQVGARTGLQALIIGTGSRVITAPFAASKPASAQSRPGIINDYLDSPENTDLDLVFDETIPRTANYNDQSFIVAP